MKNKLRITSSEDFLKIPLNKMHTHPDQLSASKKYIAAGEMPNESLN